MQNLQVESSSDIFPAPSFYPEELTLNRTSHWKRKSERFNISDKWWHPCCFNWYIIYTFITIINKIHSKKVRSENFHFLRSEFQKRVNLEWNLNEFGAKNCIFTIFGVTSGITRRSSSDPWGHSKKSENTFFAPNSLEFHS